MGASWFPMTKKFVEFFISTAIIYPFAKPAKTIISGVISIAKTGS